MENKLTKEDYNAVPVVYCKRCLSLKIISLEKEIDYCEDCGSTDVAITDIDTWQKMYKEKYGETYLNNK